MRFHHVIWDFDGTLFNTYPPASLSMQHAAKLQGAEIDYQTIYDLMKVSQGTFELFAAERYGIDRELLVQNFDVLRPAYDQRSLPYPGTVELLSDIVANGGKNYICTHRGATLYTILDAQEIRHLFTGFVTREDGFPRKPDPTCVRAILDRFQIDPKDAVMVGDRDLDILAGRNAGIAGIGFWDGTGAKVDCADYSAESMAAIRSILCL